MSYQVAIFKSPKYAIVNTMLCRMLDLVMDHAQSWRCEAEALIPSVDVSATKGMSEHVAEYGRVVASMAGSLGGLACLLYNGSGGNRSSLNWGPKQNNKSYKRE